MAIHPQSTTPVCAGVTTMAILSHISLGTNDYKRSKAFYDAVLGALQIKCMMEFDGGAGWGREFPEFWIGPPHDGGLASAGNGTHICFSAASKEEVDAFHAKAMEMGGTDDGKPSLRPQYMPNYYAAFVRDPDGNKIEAVALV
jgi:catechol 2,3-dioxygenase-like lactoylglutathione lyase family enzyme